MLLTLFEYSESDIELDTRKNCSLISSNKTFLHTEADNKKELEVTLDKRHYKCATWNNLKSVISRI